MATEESSTDKSMITLAGVALRIGSTQTACSRVFFLSSVTGCRLGFTCGAGAVAGAGAGDRFVSQFWFPRCPASVVCCVIVIDIIHIIYMYIYIYIHLSDARRSV